MTYTQEIFESFIRQKRNSIFRKNVIKKELIVPNEATEISQNEMEYINGGAIEARRCEFLGLRAKVIISGTVAELASFLADAATIIEFVSTLVSKTSWASNVEFH